MLPDQHECTALVTIAGATAFETDPSPSAIHWSIAFPASLVCTEEAWPKSRVGFWIRNYETRWLLLDIISGCARGAVHLMLAMTSLDTKRNSCLSM